MGLALPKNQYFTLIGAAISDLLGIWSNLSTEEKIEAFRQMDQSLADDFFVGLKAIDQAELLMALPAEEQRRWLRILAPDDLVDVIQKLPFEHNKHVLLAELEPDSRKEITGLLAYAEDEAGGLMNPRFARLRSDMIVGEALKYLRKQAQEHLETMRYIYVVDAEQRLLGVVSLREVFLAKDSARVRDIMTTSLVVASESMDRADLRRQFVAKSLDAIPVVDAEGRIKGIVTVDDIVGVVEDEATEDIHRLGAVQALDAPYIRLGLRSMIKKRAPWLTVLFVGEMLTASAMSYFEAQIARAVVLVMFIPLIMSSGGNSGSQASTLVVRALALGELNQRDWWKVFLRELVVGSVLGLILGGLGLARILLWGSMFGSFGEHYLRIGITVALSVTGIVLWGSLSGSMLPFLLRLLRFDPASASAPFVATVVDVSGLVIYFSLASIILADIGL